MVTSECHSPSTSTARGSRHTAKAAVAAASNRGVRSGSSRSILRTTGIARTNAGSSATLVSDAGNASQEA
ncbi:hypothetical protein GCM10029964_013690 [Kibdelosporangium lantanae]